MFIKNSVSLLPQLSLLLHPDRTTVTISISKVELLFPIFAINFTLDDYGNLPFILLPYFYFMPLIKVFYCDFSHGQAGIKPRKVYGPDWIPLMVSKSLLPYLYLAWLNFSISTYQLLYFILARSLHTFTLYLKKSDRSSSSNYLPVVLSSCLFNVF